GFAGLIDVARQLQHFLVATHLIRREAAGDHEPVKAAGLDRVDVRVDGQRITALALIGLLAQTRHGRGRTFLFKANLGIPQLEVLVQRPGEKQNTLSREAHAEKISALNASPRARRPRAPSARSTSTWA